MTQFVLLAVLAAGPVQGATPPPLTQDQLAQLRELVRTTQEASGELQEQLAAKQAALAAEYGRFELNLEASARLQGEILDLQHKLLENYHRLQVELRSIVGPQRFALLKRRIDGALNPKPKPTEEKSGRLQRPAPGNADADAATVETKK